MVRAAVCPPSALRWRSPTSTCPSRAPARCGSACAAAGVCHSDLSLTNGTMRVPRPRRPRPRGRGRGRRGRRGRHPGRARRPGRPQLGAACGSAVLLARRGVALRQRAGAAALERRTADGDRLHPALGAGRVRRGDRGRRERVIRVPDGARSPGRAARLRGAHRVRRGPQHGAGARPASRSRCSAWAAWAWPCSQSARIAGAPTVIAVDVSPEKEELAAGGRGHRLRGRLRDAAKDIRALTGGHGTDVAVECVGRAATIRTAWESTRRGGRHRRRHRRKDHLVSLNALEIFHSARTLRSVYGTSDPASRSRSWPPTSGPAACDLDHLITDRIALADVPAAFDRMARGEGARSVVLFCDSQGFCSAACAIVRGLEDAARGRRRNPRPRLHRVGGFSALFCGATCRSWGGWGELVEVRL